MAKAPVLAKAFHGRWRIVEMEVWPDDYLDLIEPAHIADPASGRGWATLGTAGRLVGHLFIHNSDDSPFVAERE